MRQGWLAAVAVIMLLAGAPSAGAARFMTGNDLLTACQVDQLVQQMECLSYVEGAIDEFELMQNLEKRPECLPPGLADDQAREAVVKYLVSHPENRELDASVLVYNALHDAWGCKWR